MRSALSAAALVAKWSTGLPATRDLTNGAETMRVLEIASEIIASGLPIDEFKAACYGDEHGGSSSVTPPALHTPLTEP